MEQPESCHCIMGHETLLGILERSGMFGAMALNKSALQVSLIAPVYGMFTFGGLPEFDSIS